MTQRARSSTENGATGGHGGERQRLTTESTENGERRDTAEHNGPSPRLSPLPSSAGQGLTDEVHQLGEAERFGEDGGGPAGEKLADGVLVGPPGDDDQRGSR